MNLTLNNNNNNNNNNNDSNDDVCSNIDDNGLGESKRRTRSRSKPEEEEKFGKAGVGPRTFDGPKSENFRKRQKSNCNSRRKS